MPIDVDALKLREIDREGEFKPFQFGDAATQAVGTGLKLQQAEAKTTEDKQKREQAAMMQKLLNGGEGALMAKLDTMDEDAQKLVFGGDRNIISHQAKTQEGNLNVWKRIIEVEFFKKTGKLPDHASQSREAQGMGLIDAKTDLGFRKPTAEKGAVSNPVFLEAQEEALAKLKALGRTPNKDEAFQIAGDILTSKGIPLNDPGAAKLTQFILTSSALPERKLERDRFEEGKTNKGIAAAEKLGAKFDDRSRNVVIAANQLNNAVEGGIYGDKFKNMVNEKFLNGLQERLDLQGTPQSMFATLLNAFTQGKVKDIAEAKRVNTVRNSDLFEELKKDPEFDKTFVNLSRLFTAVLRKESGAAITATDIEDKKNNFGLDNLATPGSFLEGLGGFFEGLRAKMTSMITSPREGATELNLKTLNKLTNPFNLPERALTGEARRDKELADIDADLELLK